MKAVEMGLIYARENFDCPLNIKIAKRDKVGDRIMIEGNAAAALGCVYGGATVAAWYPITPSTSVAEAFRAILQTATCRSGDEIQQVCHRPSGGRIGRRGNCHWCELEWRPRLYGDKRGRACL